MRSISAFKCDFCGKVFENKSSCRSHEYRCHFNPRNKSCASCLYMSYAHYSYEDSISGSPCSTGVKSCLINENNYYKLKSNCAKHVPFEVVHSEQLLFEAKKDYNPHAAYLHAISKVGGTNKLIKTPDPVDKIADAFEEVYFSLFMIVVGFNVIYEFLSHTLSDDNEYDQLREKYFNMYCDRRKLLFSLYSEFKYPEEELIETVSKMSLKYEFQYNLAEKLIENGETLFAISSGKLMDEYTNKESKYYENEKIFNLVTYIQNEGGLSTNLRELHVENYDCRLTETFVAEMKNDFLFLTRSTHELFKAYF